MTPIPTIPVAAHGEIPAAFDGRRIPAELRCSSVAYGRYAPSSRLVSRAPRPSRCDAGFHHGLVNDKTSEGVTTPSRTTKTETSVRPFAGTTNDGIEARPTTAPNANGSRLKSVTPSSVIAAARTSIGPRCSTSEPSRRSPPMTRTAARQRFDTRNRARSRSNPAGSRTSVWKPSTSGLLASRRHEDAAAFVGHRNVCAAAPVATNTNTTVCNASHDDSPLSFGLPDCGRLCTPPTPRRTPPKPCRPPPSRGAPDDAAFAQPRQ